VGDRRIELRTPTVSRQIHLAGKGFRVRVACHAAGTETVVCHRLLLTAVTFADVLLTSERGSLEARTAGWPALSTDAVGLNNALPSITTMTRSSRKSVVTAVGRP
jgi:hypothetical protein